MRKTMMVFGICGLTLMSACSNDMGRDDVQNERSGAMIVNDRGGDLYNHNQNEDSGDFGYVRHQKQDMARTHSQVQTASIDREKVADIIGEYCMTIDNVDDVSTLVTDEEVLIVYKTNTPDRNYTADQVKRMAMSVVPRWYHVYVSDNPGLRNSVSNYADHNSKSRNAEYGINQLVKQMLKSPQGKRMSTGENANGEAEGELNDDMDHDDISENLKSRAHGQRNMQ